MHDDIFEKIRTAGERARAAQPGNFGRALELASQGFAVAPFQAVIDGDCNCTPWHKANRRCNYGKHRVPHHGYKAATTNPTKIAKWWQAYPLRMVGLNTGKSGLVAFDPDARNGGDEVLAELIAELGPLPPTWSVQSGSGDVRLLFRRHVEIKSGPVVRDAGPLDVLASGDVGLILAGMHPSGNLYVDLGGEIAELPDKWVDYLTSRAPLSQKLPSIDYRNGEKGVALTWELSAAEWLWPKLRPGEPLALYAPVTCLFHPDGAHPDAGFFADPNGYVKFRCFHDDRSYTLEELYATRILNRPLPADAKNFAKLRYHLYYVSGARRPGVMTADVSGLPDWLQAVHNNLVDALAEHWVSSPGQGVMYTQRFGGARLGMNPGNVYAATKRLKDVGMIVVAGKAKIGASETLLYTTPGELFRGPGETWKDVKARGLTIEGGKV